VSASVGHGIQLYAGTNFVVRNNIIRNIPGAAIRIEGHTTQTLDLIDVEVFGNLLDNCGQNGSIPYVIRLNNVSATSAFREIRMDRNVIRRVDNTTGMRGIGVLGSGRIEDVIFGDGNSFVNIASVNNIYVNAATNTARITFRPLVASGSAPALIARTSEYWSAPVARTAAALTSGSLYTHPIYVPYNTTIDRIGLEVTTLAAGSTLSLGVYSDNGAGTAGALLFDAGTVSGATTGTFEITISQPLIGGNVYHLAVLCQGGTPTVRVFSGAWTGFNSTLANATAAANQRAGRARAGLSGTALPNPAAITTVASTVPVVAVRVV